MTQITIRGRTCELPPNCPMIQEGAEEYNSCVSWPQHLKGHWYFTPGNRTFIEIAEGPLGRSGFLTAFLCACESYWRREAERLHKETYKTGEGHQMHHWALANAEAFAAVHREIEAEKKQ